MPDDNKFPLRPINKEVVKGINTFLEGFNTAIIKELEDINKTIERLSSVIEYKLASTDKSKPSTPKRTDG